MSLDEIGLLNRPKKTKTKFFLNIQRTMDHHKWMHQTAPPIQAAPPFIHTQHYIAYT